MKNVLEHPSRTFDYVFVLNSFLGLGRGGVVRIYYCPSLQIGVAGKYTATYFTATGGRYFVGAQEESDLTPDQRAIPPYLRSTGSSGFEYGFSRLEILPTQNGSRFLALKQPAVLVTETVRVNYWEKFLICETVIELESELGLALIQIGVPAEDIELIKSHILEKFLRKPRFDRRLKAMYSRLRSRFSFERMHAWSLRRQSEADKILGEKC